MGEKIQPSFLWLAPYAAALSICSESVNVLTSPGTPLQLSYLDQQYKKSLSE